MDDRYHDIPSRLDRIAASNGPEDRQRAALQATHEILVRQRTQVEGDTVFAERGQAQLLAEHDKRIAEVVTEPGGRERVLASPALLRDVWDVYQPRIVAVTRHRQLQAQRRRAKTQLDRRIRQVSVLIAKGLPLPDGMGADVLPVVGEDPVSPEPKGPPPTREQLQALAAALRATAAPEPSLDPGAPAKQPRPAIPQDEDED